MTISMTQTIPVKAVVVGDGAVGKTSCLYCYTQGCFLSEYMPTVFDNFSANVMVGTEVVSLSLYDTAGQEDYDRLRPLAYPQTDVFMLMYSAVSRSSFDNIRYKWAPEVAHYCPDVPLVLVANKTDLVHDPSVLARLEKRGDTMVTLEEGAKLAEELGCAAFTHASAATMDGISETFDAVIKAGLLHLKHGKGWNLDAHKGKKGKKVSRKACIVL